MRRCEYKTFCVFEGALEFVVDNHLFAATVGPVLCGPMGNTHSFKDAGTVSSSMITLVTPAGFEKFFEEVEEPVADPSSPLPPPEPEDTGRL